MDCWYRHDYAWQNEDPFQALVAMNIKDTANLNYYTDLGAA